MSPKIKKKVKTNKNWLNSKFSEILVVKKKKKGKVVENTAVSGCRLISTVIVPRGVKVPGGHSALQIQMCGVVFIRLNFPEWNVP